jgi:hypothetical protein
MCVFLLTLTVVGAIAGMRILFDLLVDWQSQPSLRELIKRSHPAFRRKK